MKNLLMITGMPGAGKSHIADQISKAFKIPYLDYDSVNRHFVDIFLEKGISTSYENALSMTRDATYKALIDLTINFFKVANHIILIAPFTKEKYVCSGYIPNIKKKLGSPTTVIDISVTVSQETLYKNLTKRKLPRDEYKLRNWSEFIGRTFDEDKIWEVDHIIIYNNEKDYVDIDFLIKKLNMII